MTWLPFAILSHFFWALVNVGDKYLIGNRFKNPYAYQIILVLGGVMTVLLIPFIDFAVPNAETMKLLLVSSALWFLAGFPYIKALDIEDVTRVNIWWSFVPIFSLVIAWILLEEKLNSDQLIAFSVLIVAAFLASFHIKKKSIRFSKGFWLMIFSCFLYAGYAVAMRKIALSTDIMNALVWNSLLVVVYALPLTAFKFFRKEIKTVSFSSVKMIGAIAVLGIAANIFNIKALSLGPVALVFSMEGFQPIFVFIMVFAISFLTKIDLKEETDKANVTLKIISLVLMLLGIAVLYLT
ncbi:MAG: EamA family transporter [bacterium]|nr:EamA family transporter [bacterium]